jgi:ribosomal protein S18 acetylase RimI-like enzyme
MSDTPQIREATLEDCADVAAIAAKTFTETFGHLYDPADLALHLHHYCSADYYAQSLETGDTVLMMHLGGVLIGYARIGHVTLPVKHMIRSAQEIYRVYLLKAFQGKGYGKQLMMHILSLPRVQVATAVYLGVWENNFKAQSLYKLYGFEVIDRYQFPVGNHIDIDLIMVRKK